MKYLNVAEKKSAASQIADFLSDKVIYRENCENIDIFEFEANVMNQKSEMVMTYVSGHLTDLKYLDSYQRDWKSCEPFDLFDKMVINEVLERNTMIKKTLEREVLSCDGLIIWTDCDREGENIGFEIIQVCLKVKSSLTVYRAKFSAITRNSVKNALAQLGAPEKNISDAVDVRKILDLRTGFAFTRYQTLRLRNVIDTKEVHEKSVSYGSCQFPTLGFVVERYKEVKNFNAEPYWEIKVSHTTNGLSVDFAREPKRLFSDSDSCQVLYDTCMQSPQAKVCDVKTERKLKFRPLPLVTVELEKLASRKLGIRAKDTMKFVESMYTDGFISYPRTETNKFPEDFNLEELVKQQIENPKWGQFAQGILDSGGPTPREGDKSDNAHPPLYPTKIPKDLTKTQTRLYELIVRTFLACCSKDAQVQETTVTIDVAGERFRATGLKVTERNYLEVYPYDNWSSKEIHVYEAGQTFNPNIEMVKGETSPPELLTEADLIDIMVQHGIGTNATHAKHIARIEAVQYVKTEKIENNDKEVHFKPTPLGLGLVEGYCAMRLDVDLDITKPNLRAKLEADLKAICEGSKRPERVLAEQISIYKQLYQTVTENAEQIDKAVGKRLGVSTKPFKPWAINAQRDDDIVKCECKKPAILSKEEEQDENFGTGEKKKKMERRRAKLSLGES